jgi:SAM-dependent methyltransferase
MDRWKYYDITHRDHVVCNPTSVEKLDELIALLDLKKRARVLDIACGKAELLIRIIERYGCSGVGVDLSPYFIASAREKAKARVGRSQTRGRKGARLELIEGDGAAYDGESGSFDLVMCLGASWIWGGHRNTLAALMRWTKPYGLVLVGEPFWAKEPDADYLKAIEVTREMFGTHEANVRTGIELKLAPLYTMVSSGDDWDRYEGLQWRASERWAAAHPDDPDREAVLKECRRHRDSFLRSGRDSLGWALYLFRK